MLLRTALFLALAMGVTARASHAEEPTARTPVQATAISSALRDRLDRLALRQPGETLGEEEFRSVEGFSLGLLGGTSKDEVRRAYEVHLRLLDGRPVAPTPAVAQRVFDRLVAELPPHLNPDAFPYRLTVLDLPGADAFTTGGGYVYLTRPEVERLLADPDRGEAALAFVLAAQIGHVALGHCRRGWELEEAAEQVGSYVPFILPHKVLSRVVGSSATGRFAYTGGEQDEADRFALHLCRNAGVDLDAALDAVRALAVRDPMDDKDETQTVDLRDGAFSDALMRLKRLLMERDGLFDDETQHGLYLYDRSSRQLARCGPRQIGAGQRPIVLVHGFRGNEYALVAYLFFLGKQAELADRPLLIFRYPNNESLSRCGQFLTREMRRCVAQPEKAVFVCHSAGGLVFRWYAEVRKGGFDRAIFMATPHAGTRLAALKGFVDVGRFALDLSDGPEYALSDAFGEGDGQIAHDLQPDSLFLRLLGRETPPVKQYQIFYGQLFDWLQALELQAGFAVAKTYLEEAVADFVPFPGLQGRLRRLVDEAPLPEEFTRGDLVVSVRSASLPGVARTTGVAIQHEAFRYDPEMLRLVLAAILKE